MRQPKEISLWSVGLSGTDFLHDKQDQANFKKHLDNVLDTTGPTYSSIDSLSYLGSDAAFPLVYMNSILPGSVRRVIEVVNVNYGYEPATQQCKHSIACLLQIYAKLVFKERTGIAGSGAGTERSASLSQHLEHLQQIFPGDVGICAEACTLDDLQLVPHQLDGLLYLFNLMSGYVLASLVGSSYGSQCFQQQLMMAWPRVQKLLATVKCPDLGTAASPRAGL
ncbi:hypothetical protein VFPPC_11966 [Pochonia chlamydosporia 170]|uniref:Uncharacterized protein n=1 Tax=Pochonia chlamydosporia 170 TaxID=1380566 RepID=A0A179F0R6_METCM|nr:hypothetical protein VFPPC_11966 [Pochonia chlamydosporia 170]OAQ59044.1 hypothetical protein VFPPC_11966 [Pochonia chlamydosporia 170]